MGSNQLTGNNPDWNDWTFNTAAYYSVEFDGGGLPTQLVSGPASGDFFPIGATTVTYEAVDASGNSVQCSFDVTVNDTEAPQIFCPADISQNATSSNGAVVTFADATATDNSGM